MTAKIPELFLGLLRGAWVLALGPSFARLPTYHQEVGFEAEQLEHEPALTRNAGATGGCLNL